MIFRSKDTHNAGVEDGEAPTAQLRRFFGILSPLLALGYLALMALDFDAHWPNGIAIGVVAQDAGLIAEGDRNATAFKLSSYESGERCIIMPPALRAQLARAGGKQGMFYDVRVGMIPRLGRNLCKTSQIPFGRFYEVVSVDSAVAIGCAPDVFIARSRQCELPKVNQSVERVPPPAIVPSAPPIELATNDVDPPPPAPYRPFAGQRPPPVLGLDGPSIDLADFYPSSAVRLEQEGVVRVRVIYIPNNGSISCTVLESSGYSALDRQTCRLVGNHRLFTPSARGEDGDGEVTITQGVRWTLPE